MLRSISCLTLLASVGISAFSARAAEDAPVAPVAPPNPAAFSSYVAQINKIADGALTIQTLRGHSGIVETINLDAKTQIVLSGKPAKLSDLKADQWIRVHWNYGDDKKTVRIVKIEDSQPPPAVREDKN